jgi:DNA-binding beta-propeller fold protein YncE
MRSGRPRILDIAGVLLLVAAVAVAVVLVTRSGDDDGGGGESGRKPNTAKTLSGDQPGVNRIALGPKVAPRSLAADGEGVYVVDVYGSQVLRVDGRSRKVTFRTKVPGPGEIAVDGERRRAWTALQNRKQLAEIDTATGKVVGKPFDVQREPTHLVLSDEEVLILSSGSAKGRLLRVSKDTQRDIGRPEPLGGTTDLTVGGPGIVVVGGVFSPEIITFTPSLEAKDHFSPKVDGTPSEVRVDGNVIWMTLFRSGAFETTTKGAVVRVDLNTGRMIGKPIEVDQDPAGLAVDGDSVWVVSKKEGTLTRIDKRTGRIRGKPIFLGERIIAGDVAASGGNVWVTGANELFHYRA